MHPPGCEDGQPVGLVSGKAAACQALDADLARGGKRDRVRRRLGCPGLRRKCGDHRGRSGAWYPADMEARVALVLFAVISLASGFAGAPRNDRGLEAANPVRPLPAPPLGINRLDDFGQSTCAGESPPRALALL